MNYERKDLLGPQRETVLIGSKDLPYGQLVRKELEVGGENFVIEALSRVGQSYVGIKKDSEDGASVIMDDHSLSAFVVDGGTQPAPIPSIEARGIRGGLFIARHVEEDSQRLDPSVSVVTNLHRLNFMINEDVVNNNLEIDYSENSHTVPYGSIAGVRIDTFNGTIEVANAGDVHVIAVDKDGIGTAFSYDDVAEWDQKAFEKTLELAKKFGMTFRETMQARSQDERLKPIVDQMYETMRLGNTNDIGRITGSPNFEVTSSVMAKMEDIQSVIIFSDGAIPGGLDMRNRDDVQTLTDMINERGLMRLEEEVRARVDSDSDFEKYPRFGNLDDLLILKIDLNSPSSNTN